jgi:hypothetical protein
MQVQLASARVVHDEQDLDEKVCLFPFHSSAMLQGFLIFPQLLNRNNFYFIFCDQQFRFYWNWLQVGPEWDLSSN